MKIGKLIYIFLENAIETYRVSRCKANELKKAKDPRRMAISSTVVLTPAQKKEIDEFYLSNYGHKIPYYWHCNFTAHSGKYDKEYFPELLYIPEFERYMNCHRGYERVFADKNVLPHLAKSADVKTPQVVLSITRKLITDSFNNILTKAEALTHISNCGEVFVKPSVDSDSGRGCFIANFVNGVDVLSGKSAEQILASVGENCVMQRVIKNHPSIAKIYSGSVNTFRIITYRWKDELLHMPVIMRIGKDGSYLDNAHAGGMFVAIDDDGTMHKTAMTEFNQKFEHHPNTKAIFAEQKIDLLPAVIAAAKRMHSIIPQVGVVNWDFTIDESGDPVLIEANTKGGAIWVIEMAHGRSGFEGKTAEVLQWMKMMRKIKPSERYKYTYGYVE